LLVETFEKKSRIRASAQAVFAFHERKEALRLLSPPWQRVTVVQPPRSLAVGTRVVIRVGVGPVRRTMVFEHVAYVQGKSFTDKMLVGPLKHWVHEHIVVPEGEGDRAANLIDRIEYSLPLGLLGALALQPIARYELERLFAYRHEITRAECEGDGS
jgi:ligand-binding SRPBCC domain-containing protein